MKVFLDFIRFQFIGTRMFQGYWVSSRRLKVSADESCNFSVAKFSCSERHFEIFRDIDGKFNILLKPQTSQVNGMGFKYRYINIFNFC